MHREGFGNLVLTRYPDESVRILHKPTGDVLWVGLVKVRGDRAYLSFSGPREYEVMRKELVEDLTDQP